MNGISFRTQMTSEVDVAIADSAKVEQYCADQTNNTQSLDEFAERLSVDFWNATPQETNGKFVRNVEQIGSFVEGADGFSYTLESQHTEMFGEITLTISKEFNSEKVENIQ